MKNIPSLPVAVLFILFSVSCKQNNKPDSAKQEVKELSMSMYEMADTIIYDVFIKNPNPEDSWGEECLKHLNHAALVDSMFSMVYSGRAIALDIFTNEKLSSQEVMEMEKNKDFSRDKIGKMQFAEKWYFDPMNNRMEKKVLSIALGYELYDDDGNVKFYRPLFKVVMN